MSEANSAQAELNALLSDFPFTKQLCDAVINLRPAHGRFLLKGMRVRSADLMATTERLAEAIVTLCPQGLLDVSRNYLWTCERLNEEELYFHRNGCYRLKTFEEAYAEVYSNTEYMEQYMSGLLMTQVLWYNHAASFDFFLKTAKELLPPHPDYLEIGPGHGLMLYLSMKDLSLKSVIAWDVSEVSIAQTKLALQRLGVGGCEFAVQNIVSNPLTQSLGTFDIIVLSEILEHLENPREVLEKMSRLLKPNGVVFVNIPITSPSPDHLYLLNNEAEAIALLESAGLTVVKAGFFPTQGMDLAKAIKQRVSVSACLFGRKKHAT